MNLFEKLKYIVRSIFSSAQITEKDSKDKEYEETSEIIASLKKHFQSLEQNNKEPMRMVLLKKLIELKNKSQNFRQQGSTIKQMQLMFPQQKSNYINLTQQKQNQPISTPTFHNQNFDTQNYFIKQHIPQFMMEQKLQQPYESRDQQTFFHQNQLQINISLESISFQSQQSHFTFGQSNSFGSQIIQQSIINSKDQQTKFGYNNMDCKNQTYSEAQKGFRPKPKLFIFPEILEDICESTILTDNKFSGAKETL